jgi:hypothetical protein
MYRGSPDPTSSTVTVSSTPKWFVIWRADESALTDVTFVAGDWVINLYKTGPDQKAFNASIGIWDGSVFTAKGNASGYDNGYFTFTISADGFTVPEGDWLAYWMLCTEGSGSMELDTAGGVCNVTSPQGSPPYPIPELATAVLFGAGLLALVGYVGYRKRRGH